MTVADGVIPVKRCLWDNYIVYVDNPLDSIGPRFEWRRSRRLPCRAVEKGETASVPSGTGIENWEPGTTASCAARRRRSNESIAARDVAHSALYSCPGRTATIVS